MYFLIFGSIFVFNFKVIYEKPSVNVKNSPSINYMSSQKYKTPALAHSYDGPEVHLR